MKTESNGKHFVIPERYVDIKTVSRYTSIPVNTLYEWTKLGKFPSIKLGRKILFDLQEIDKVMSNLKRPYLQHDKTANKIIRDLQGNGI